MLSPTDFSSHSIEFPWGRRVRHYLARSWIRSAGDFSLATAEHLPACPAPPWASCSQLLWNGEAWAACRLIAQRTEYIPNNAFGRITSTMGYNAGSGGGQEQSQFGYPARLIEFGLKLYW